MIWGLKVHWITDSNVSRLDLNSCLCYIAKYPFRPEKSGETSRSAYIGELILDVFLFQYTHEVGLWLYLIAPLILLWNL